MHLATPVFTLFLQSLLYFSFTHAQSSSYWLANIQRQGKVAFGNQSYPVFRNVKDYGARGDGVTDDTAAINLAVSTLSVPGANPPGVRCGGGNLTYGKFCPSDTTTPALVYFPPGTYVISKPIVLYYFTQVVGDAVTLPIIKVPSTFTKTGGIAVFDANIYYGDKVTWWDNQSNFYRQIRNFIFDMTTAPKDLNGIHWQVAQATSLQNIKIIMAPKSDQNKQVGVFMENGSGGFFSDIVISGGLIGLAIGSQQFTIRNITIDGTTTGIKMFFDWIWTFSQIKITNCDVGLDMAGGGFNKQDVSAVILFDSLISASIGIVTVYVPGYSSPQSAGTLMLERVDFKGSGVAISASADGSSRLILAGGQYVELFGQGNAWTTAGQGLNGQTFNGTTCSFQNSTQRVYSAQEMTIQRLLAPIPRPSRLVDSNGNIVGRSRPQYEDIPVSGFMSAKTFGLRGDGLTDDTAMMQQFFSAAANDGKIAYLDRGAYLVSNTVNVPKDLKITGEALTVVMATGSYFNDQYNPKVMWKIGMPGEVGSVEITDIVFETKGPAPGAIIIEWNIKAVRPAGAGMWDAHWRIGGSAGTGLQPDKCLKNMDIQVDESSQILKDCSGAFLLLHVTTEGNGYFENIWGWVADHELDAGRREQLTIYNGRGFLFESAEGPNWLWGTSAEHSTLYDYQFINSKYTWMGHIQHETAYFQNNPNALLPFVPQPNWHDPTFEDCTQANCVKTWGLRFVNCSHMYMYGGGHYMFFEKLDSAPCLGTETCQERMVDFRNSTDIYLWGLATKGSEYMISWEGASIVPQSVNKAVYVEVILLFEMAYVGL